MSMTKKTPCSLSSKPAARKEPDEAEMPKPSLLLLYKDAPQRKPQKLPTGSCRPGCGAAQKQKRELSAKAGNKCSCSKPQIPGEDEEEEDEEEEEEEATFDPCQKPASNGGCGGGCGGGGANQGGGGGGGGGNNGGVGVRSRSTTSRKEANKKGSDLYNACSAPPPKPKCS